MNWCSTVTLEPPSLIAFATRLAFSGLKKAWVGLADSTTHLSLLIHDCCAILASKTCSKHSVHLGLVTEQAKFVTVHDETVHEYPRVDSNYRSLPCQGSVLSN